MLRNRFPHLARRASIAVIAVTTMAVSGCEDLVGVAEELTAVSTGPTIPAGAFGGRVNAFGTRTHSLYIGVNDNYVLLRGDGDTDLDCYLYNPSGLLVSYDLDPSDTCVLSAPGIGTHQLVIRNLGGVYNDYTFWRTR
jgi:hypothetical protein